MSRWRPTLEVRRGKGGGIFSQVSLGSGRPIEVVLFGVTGVVSWIAGWQLHPALLVLAMFFFSFSVVNAIDVARRKFQKS